MLTTHLAGIMLAEEGLSPTRSIPKTSTSLKWDAGFKYVLWAYMDWRHLHFPPCTQDDWPVFAY